MGLLQARRRNIVHIGGLTLLTLDLDGSQLSQLQEVILRDVRIDELHNGLDELFDAVHPIGLHIVHGIQNGEDDLEGADPGVVGGVLDDGEACLA